MALNLITPELKDKVLLYLCTHYKLERYSSTKCSTEFESDLGIDFELLRIILAHFQRLGLIKHHDIQLGNFVGLIVYTESHDFLLKGGFVFKDGMFLANADKLLLEIDNLKKKLEPDQLGSIEKITNIANTLVGALSAYRTFITP